ncbi:hypothetical protein [Methylobacterium planeticum]|uniref:Sulfotransferase n=1 Tax=Methylobacterium planeticum TaxID=2615211 RepID=A0A6N6MLF0_9HYPH|nr:hypothetical protein [Methylobacterium planeticum]KAB1070565.1 hypothetical protein F6X51_22115 [Methylobacterium planeticum]
MRRGIIHIGMPRTGSTSLQAVLTTLRPQLGGVGLLYPELAPPGSPAGADVNHQPLGEALDGRRPARERAAALARLSGILGSTRADTVILSYEDFAVQKPGLGIPRIVHDLFKAHGFRTEVAIVVKPQFEQLNSAYAHLAQLVRETRTFRGFARQTWRSGRLDYAALIEPWRRAADGRVTAIPLRDARSEAPLLQRVVRDLGLADRLFPLMSAETQRLVTNRSPGPIAVEAARRLRRLRVHRQVRGHSRRIGHVLDDAAWSRGLDPEPFRGEAPEMRARVEARYALPNERFAHALWGVPWSAAVQQAPPRPPNELAGHAIPPETEAQIETLMAETVRHFGFRAPAPWQRVPADLAEAAAEHLARLVGYSRWRVP